MREILAMANRPSYDPNNYNQSGEETFKNIAVTNLYEPGSTFKPIVASATLASGKWKLEQIVRDKGARFVANGHVMRNWNGEGYGPVRLLDILKYSVLQVWQKLVQQLEQISFLNMYAIMVLALKRALNCLVKGQVSCIIRKI